MSTDLIAHYRNKVKRMAKKNRPRYLRNQGIDFVVAYFILFNRLPRIN